MKNMKLTLISANGKAAFVWMPDKGCHGRYGYADNGKCYAPQGIFGPLLGIRRGDCIYSGG
tara:strand:+ start:170 stop:352 length:183 start_codon:yes stop_codon:yes gene_type:complete